MFSSILIDLLPESVICLTVKAGELALLSAYEVDVRLQPLARGIERLPPLVLYLPFSLFDGSELGSQSDCVASSLVELEIEVIGLFVQP